MVELNLEEQVQKIMADTGMPSESSQSAAEAEAASGDAAKLGKVYDSKTVGQEMPELIEVTEPMELTNQTPVYFRSKKGEYRYFYFVVDKPCVVKIDTWPLDE